MSNREPDGRMCRSSLVSRALGGSDTPAPRRRATPTCNARLRLTWSFPASSYDFFSMADAYRWACSGPLPTEASAPVIWPKLRVRLGLISAFRRSEGRERETKRQTPNAERRNSPPLGHLRAVARRDVVRLLQVLRLLHRLLHRLRVVDGRSTSSLPASRPHLASSPLLNEGAV